MISPLPHGAPTAEPIISQIVTAIVDFCRRFKWGVLALAAAITVFSGWYAATHFDINTNTNDFISAKLPWRQNLIAMDKAFPQRADQIVVVIDGKTPELAEEATQRLAEKLRTKPDLFTFVLRPDGGPFFNKNGLLYLPVDEVKNTIDGLFKAQPFLSVLASDQSLRGVTDAFSFINRGVRTKAGTYDDFDRPLVALGDAFDSLLADRPTFFSWRGLLTGEAPDPRELRRFIQVKAVLDYSALQPGAAPSNFIRQAWAEMGYAATPGLRLRLTGLVPLADEEFATVEDGAGLNGAITGLIVLFIIWRALRSPSIVLAVTVSVVVGLFATAAVGLWMVGALNLISVAFAVLFVGIGVDFGIQYSVRYRAERHKVGDFDLALNQAAAKIGRPLALAAAATAAGFYSFLPTDYRGVSELGLIAGTGMFIAFFASITVLPALLAVFKPPAEEEGVGYLFLAPADEFLSRHRHAVVIGTLAVALAGTPLLAHLRFDFNPINLRSPNVESVSTLLDLMKDPATDTNTIDVLAPSIEASRGLAARLSALPEVAQVVTIESFVPVDQDQKLPLIEKAAAAFAPILDPTRMRQPPTDAEDVAAMLKAAEAFEATAGDAKGKGADDARRLGELLRKMAAAPPATREAARKALLPGLATMLSLLRDSLSAQRTTIESIPADLKSDWVAADGRARIAVSPKGDGNDNATLARFTTAVQQIDPEATGEPIAIQESGNTVVRAFIEAGIWALLSISILLWIVLRRFSDVLLTLVPLLLAGVVTLEITVLIGLPLNFANIIALPLLLGLGVAFKIYFVMAWRAGTTNLLQSSLTRAVFFSAMTTATAFGSLWLSKHPGTSSMGKLLALSLLCTLAAAILFQPALMGPPRKVADTGEDD
ncbi:hopanoid biosynthesis associated RND transporter like protein HpnN [Methylocella silvestris BL2]|uniref:Hopanoid biosynthesis associated RND transporter like protein HpnN n=1 Tax=Methylocella silvestris (strain DSM 15510 / CIP 108128 / LMG 27833 / NCIMB 13906 / BL2) TaxID=395965 RepID=B8EQE0_METSB|nr:MMPL family transporter [Methylocella silvestris]ACK52153.1 hopanoid biosynthesis associated RND transporter like protein HpnN [Methylocella silvestris BL2]